MPASIYRRLPGRAPRLREAFVGAAALHLGDDHLLQSTVRFYVQTYQRFAYQDIQALLLRQTPRGVIYSAALGALGALFSLLAWAQYDRRGGAVALAIIAGFFLGLLVVNLARGGTCRCHLQTALGPHALPSLSRVRPARRALERIAARVEAAQSAAPGAAGEA